MSTTKVVVSIPEEASYDVCIGSGLLDSLGNSLRTCLATSDASQLLIITDENVAPLYLAKTRKSCVSAGFRVSDITVPAGESAKNLEVLGEVWEAMASLALDRSCVVVALGGGVVGDLAGFVAATYMRGVAIVQVPTTLLAMVDSSVGGKTAVNLQAGKNLVGSFKQPVYVCADTDTLNTLPEREWTCGLGEVAKSAAIDSDDFFFWLMSEAQALRAREGATVVEAIMRCVVFKAGIVAKDKQESCGVRECLNYGHTLGHAIELLEGYGTYSHGAAVAEGMRFAARLGMRVLNTPEDFVQAQDTLLEALGLKSLQLSIDSHDIFAALKRDKKTRNGIVRFVLPYDVGSWKLEAVDEDILQTALRDLW